MIRVEEFVDRADIAGAYEELRHGEVFVVPWPKQRVASLHHRIRTVLARAVGARFVVEVEMGFRALPEYELRKAGVGLIERGRWERAEFADYIFGAPEIVIEVESPSNTAREFREKEDLCLANGSISFWVVYPDLREVTVAYAEGSRTYREGDAIELRGIADARVSVADLLGPVAR